MANILVFGDSIAWGAFDSEKGGWVERLKLHFWKDYDIDVYNLGISGSKTADVLERFGVEARTVEAQTRGGGELTLMFAVGINDSYFIHSKNANQTSPDSFKKNIQEIVGQARKFSPRIVFIGLTPVCETKTTPIPWEKDKSFKNDYVEKYNKIIKFICKEKEVYFVEIFDEWRKTNYENLLEDGLHPNSAGHQKIFERVKDFLIQNKIIKI